jgi:ABC-2 type transport system permease protein
MPNRQAALRAFAAVEIPEDTERDVLKGITAHIPIYADATYLFVFRSTASGVATAIGALTSDLVARGARSDGSLVKAKLAGLSPADILLSPFSIQSAAMPATSCRRRLS